MDGQTPAPASAPLSAPVNGPAMASASANGDRAAAPSPEASDSPKRVKLDLPSPPRDVAPQDQEGSQENGDILVKEVEMQVVGQEGEQGDDEKPAVVEEVVFPMVCAWKGAKYDLQVPESETVGDLKALLYSLTSVPPERQKIVGLVAGKLPTDDVPIASLQLGSKVKAGKIVSFTMIGTPEGGEIKRPEDMGDVANDLDIDYLEQMRYGFDPATNTRNRRKLVEAADKLTLDIMNPPRPGKKLLVLDLDYTLLDAKAYSDTSVHALDMSRPYLQEFLSVLSPYYDFCIWSQTHWRWLESKLVELNMIGGPNDHRYLINFVIDRTPMFSVYSNKDGKMFKHEVKALEIIWRKVPQFNAANTLHLDDLSRNFAMNPKNGVKCHAFKHARRHQSDRELVHLAKYFLMMAPVDDVRAYDHSKWKKCKLPLPPGAPDPEADLPAGYDRHAALGRRED